MHEVPHPAATASIDGHRVPRWLRFVMAADRAGSAWYIGTGFFFAPVLAVVSPWPAVTAVVWVAIALAGLWLGLLGVAMAAGLAVVLRSNAELPEEYWRSLIDYPVTPGAPQGSPPHRCSPPASA